MSTPTLHPRVRFKTPAVCHKSTPPPPDILPGTFPPDVSGFCLWTDEVPGNEVHVSSTALLQLVDPAGKYEGQTPEETLFIRCTLQLIHSSNLWRLQMHMPNNPAAPPFFAFANFPVDLTVPFDTGLLNEDVGPIPGVRRARFRF